MLLPLVLLTGFYFICIFPFAYFRHDDWLILGNSVLHLPNNWSYALSPTLYFSERETAWFFRPLFKLFVYFFYQAFGLNYYLWLVGIFSFFVGALLLGARIVTLVTDSSRRSVLFIVLLAACFQMHFGSLAWMGEGMMNTPQVFLLALNLYLYVRGVLDGKPIWFFAAFIAFFISLGGKESSVFHPALLFLMTWIEPKLRSRISFKKLVVLMIPYGVLCVGYLVMRLWLMPMNPHYFTGAPWYAIAKQIGLLIASPGLFLFAWWVALGKNRKAVRAGILPALRKRWLYFAFLALCMSPYIGHQFFSPGWLYYPAFYFALIFAFLNPQAEASIDSRFLAKAGAVAFVLSIVPILFLLTKGGWWKWSEGSRQLISIVKEAPESTEGMIFYDCVNPQYPAARMDRVVGYQDGFYFLWRMHHPKPIAMKMLECDAPESEIPPPFRKASVIRLRWDFPRFSQLAPVGD